MVINVWLVLGEKGIRKVELELVGSSYFKKKVVWERNSPWLKGKKFREVISIPFIKILLENLLKGIKTLIESNLIEVNICKGKNGTWEKLFHQKVNKEVFPEVIIESAQSYLA